MTRYRGHIVRQGGSIEGNKLLRPGSALKEWMEWRLLRPASAFKERTESRLIRYALEHRKPGTEALLSHMRALGAELILPRGDHVLRIPPDRLGKKILREGAYERDIFERALSLMESHGRLHAGGVLLDVGANIGMHTVYGHLSGRFDKVLAIEPCARNFQILEFNVRENGFESKTSMVRCAGGRNTGVARLYLDPMNGATATLIKATDEFEVVEVRPLDSILAELAILPSNIGMVWVDVMGSEIDVLAGMPGVISAGLPLVLELSNKRFDYDKNEIFGLLSGSPYTSFIDLRSINAECEPLKNICHLPRRHMNLLIL